MTLYMIRHKPSGLFFIPNQRAYRRENLSERGKIYHRKPALKTSVPNAVTRQFSPGGGLTRLLREDFEILVYEARYIDTL